MAKNKSKYIDKLRKKYRLIIYNDQNFEEIWSGRVTKMNLYLLGFFSFVLILLIMTLLFIFTPINRLLPAYANSEMQSKILENAMRVDSLEYQIHIRDQYFERINSIIRGENPGAMPASNQSQEALAAELFYPSSKHDSILRKQIEEEEQYNLSILNRTKTELDFSKIHFFIPIKGIITNKFNRNEKHFGLDVVSEPNKPILSTLDGTVIAANWTLATGYVIQIQHDYDLISIYKHNSALLKQVGDHVKAGETIAIIGNTGEYSTGPHLHFELWHNGTPLNPEDYLVF